MRYPFGYGLSYTSFTVTGTHTDPLGFQAEVTNTGKHPGKAVVMLFVEKPCGVLGNPTRELVAFGKTRLLSPGQSQSLSFSVTEYQLSSYDDSGITGHKSCYVLQQGAYRFYCGENVRDTQFIGDYMIPELRVLRSLSEACAPKEILPYLGQRERHPCLPGGLCPHCRSAAADPGSSAQGCFPDRRSGNPAFGREGRKSQPGRLCGPA